MNRTSGIEEINQKLGSMGPVDKLYLIGTLACDIGLSRGTGITKEALELGKCFEFEEDWIKEDGAIALLKKMADSL